MNIRIVRRGEQIVELRRMIFNESKGKKRSSFHHSVSVKKRRTIKCTKTLWFNYSRVSWKTEPRKERGGLSVFIIYVSLFQAPTLLTFLHVRFAPLSISWTLSWFYCRNSVFFFPPAILQGVWFFSLHSVPTYVCSYVCVIRYWLVRGCKDSVSSPDWTSIRKPCRVEKVGDETGKERVSMGRRNRSKKVGAVIDNLRGFSFYFLASSSLSVHRRLSQLYHCSSTFWRRCSD